MLDLHYIYSSKQRAAAFMSDDRIREPREFDRGFTFVSFGVRVSVGANDVGLLEKVREVVRRAFGGAVEFFEVRNNSASVCNFGVDLDNGVFRLFEDGVEAAEGVSERNFLKYLDSCLRLKVAEFSERRVFIHAGVVGWRGEAIMVPGLSMSGKSTLTAELVKLGCEYYSDEYAVLEKDGRVTPFPRHLSLRGLDGKGESETSAAELGGTVGTEAIPVGMVLFTRYESGAGWAPERLTPGAGIMELIPNTLTIRRDPAFSLKVLDLVAQRAIMVKSPRGEAREFAKFLLEIFDIDTKLAKMT
jgi:hypothetical protein